MKTTKLDEIPCWRCGKIIFAVSDITGDKTPKPGDVSLCISCGAPAIFVEGMSMRQPTEEEMDEILKDKDALKHVIAIMLANALASKE